MPPKIKASKMVIYVIVVAMVAAAVGFYATTLTAPAKDVDHVVFVLDWIIGGEHAPFFLALDKGYYAEEKLSVTILRGYGSADTIKRAVAGEAQFGFIESTSQISAMAKNPEVNLKYVAMLFESPLTLYYIKGGPINVPKDLAGKVIGLTPGANQFYVSFLQTVGIDRASVTEVVINPGDKVAALPAGSINVAVDYYQSLKQYQLAAAKAGKEIGYFRLAEYGLVYYSTGISVKDSYLKDKADIVKGFLRASMKGWLYAKDRPDDAIEALVKYNRESDKDIAAVRLGLALGDVFRPEAYEKGLGYMSADKWKSTSELTVKFFQLDKAPSVETIYTNDYLTNIVPKKS